MAKRKMKFDKDAIGNLFVRHGEKMGLGVALLLLGYFVYAGMQGAGLETDQTPSRLVEVASMKERQINSATFDAFAPVRTAKVNL